MPPYVIQHVQKKSADPSVYMLASVIDHPQEGDMLIKDKLYRFLIPDDFGQAKRSNVTTSNWALFVYSVASPTDTRVPDYQVLLQDAEYQNL